MPPQQAECLLNFFYSVLRFIPHGTLPFQGRSLGRVAPSVKCEKSVADNPISKDRRRRQIAKLLPQLEKFSHGSGLLLQLFLRRQSQNTYPQGLYPV